MPATPVPSSAAPSRFVVLIFLIVVVGFVSHLVAPAKATLYPLAVLQPMCGNKWVVESQTLPDSVIRGLACSDTLRSRPLPPGEHPARNVLYSLEQFKHLCGRILSPHMVGGTWQCQYD